jgi:hypothetical protein
MLTLDYEFLANLLGCLIVKHQISISSQISLMTWYANRAYIAKENKALSQT